jgi:hypothetical protein
VAAILPQGLKFAYLADYGASDITAGLPNWQPLFARGHNVGMVSWFEFDGCMMLAQSWAEALHANIRAAHAQGIRSICFNHWRVRSLEAGAHIAADACFDASLPYHEQFAAFSRRLYGAGREKLAVQANQALEAATHYAKRHNYNIGFTVDWVIRHSTEPPGYSWKVLRQSTANYRRATQAFDQLARQSSGWGQAQAAYLRDLCQISAEHIEAVEHLQNAKLPLVGFKAWPLDNPRAAWPAPELLAVLLEHARQALQLEEGYMRTYAGWVESCDEQGQLAMHQLGVIEPLTGLVNQLAEHLKEGSNWHVS